ncbi:glucosidase II [Blastocladiella emersonii ATCC 22665]|nr:glucosidase II [Blastocladiella emersonii ATCC 22665]
MNPMYHHHTPRRRPRAALHLPLALALAAVTACTLLLLAIATPAAAVKREDFKTCAQSAFCRRHRAWPAVVPSLPSAWTATPSPNPAKDAWRASLVAPNTPSPLTLEVTSLGNAAVRVRVVDPADPRPRVFSAAEVALVARTGDGEVTVVREDKTGATLRVGKAEVRVTYTPLRVALVTGGVEQVVVNDRNWLRVETGAVADLDALVAGVEDEEKAKAWRAAEEDGVGKEGFKEHTDSKPYGARSVGFDLTFPATAHAYGLAEHATDFNLPSTRGADAKYAEPYRLYNLDVFEFELDSPMALYGAVPFLLTQGDRGAAGALVLSASEMWVDVERTSSSDLLAHWMVESAPLDLVLLAGPTAADVHAQYMRLTGFPTLPPLFGVAYHQCRWNYNDEADVRDVDAGFDTHDIPYDVLWLDIEHTDGKRYFTWDALKFPNPAKMIDGVAAKGRKMVTIVDPHIKKDDQYYVSAEATAKDLLVKSPPPKDNAAPAPFGGWCWPGDSNWIDFLNPAARDWWASLFSPAKYAGSTRNLFTWNDMNEPSVFTGPEITMPKDALHVGGLEHRDVHNVYGMQQHRATHAGHLARTSGSLDAIDRPFVLSRAFFAGTQRYGAIWTGDNFARWDHLASSTPMLLGLAASGIVFAGADVGGFFGNPDPELLVRWYQLGAMQPFFRAHAHIDTKRREPWLFDDATRDLIRAAVRRRYRWMPTVYTAFFDAWRTGSTVNTPLVFAFPDDRNTWASQDAFLLGTSILVAPATQPGQREVTTYLPAGTAGAGWYDMASSPAGWRYLRGAQSVTVAAPLDTLPLFARAGSVLVARERVRRASAAGLTDPLTLYIALDKAGRAAGHFVVDDGQTYGVLAGAAVEVRVTFADGTLRASLSVPTGIVPARPAVGDERLVSQRREIKTDDGVRGKFMHRFGGVRVERVVVVAPSAEVVSLAVPGQVRVGGKGVAEVTVRDEGRWIEVKEPGFRLGDEGWEMQL